MKIQVTQENLNKALGSVARVASSRNTLPILANVLIKTVGTRLSISATNLDIAITHYIGSKVSEEGSITIPARLVQDFVSSLPSGIIELKLDEYKLHFSTGTYRSTINGISSEEFPVLPAIKDGKKWSINSTVLKKKLQQVIIAASNDDTRPVLTGVYFLTQSNKLKIVATDSYRLAEATIEDIKDSVDILVPINATQELLRILSDYDGDVHITHDDQQVLFSVGDIELVARLIEGKYPNYSSLIPSKFTTSARLPKAELLNITKVSSLFARENAGSITLEVDDHEQTISIHSIASQLGENIANSKAKIKGDGSITINSRYLLDALHVMNGEEVVFSFNGKLEPSLLSDPEDKDYIHIIMPLKS
jgi:DNA polymerase III subunit beta